MVNLWRGADEVKDFHPVVEDCLDKALKNAGLEDRYEIKHHLGIFTSGIPDFCVLDKVTGDFVCIIEVKKKPSDVFFRGSNLQAKGYVEELYPLRWKANYYPYFCVTNIEFTQFYSLRKNASLVGCLLTGSPHDSGLLTRQEECIENFIQMFTDFFIRMEKRTEPEFSKHLEAISESFNETFYDIAKILGVNLARMNRLVSADQKVRQSILYELLRFAFYYYIRETYSMKKDESVSYFNDFGVEGLSNLEMISLIHSNFEKAMEIDFSDILKDFPSTDAIIPTRLSESEELGVVFNAFIQTLRDNAHQGIQRNYNLDHFVSLLTSEVYDKEEMHMSGKIMSDEVLSNILADLAISRSSGLVTDPCCGDGNLLTASYKRLVELEGKNGGSSSHNELLGRLHGIEIDPNLIQLAAFKLICRNLDEVDKSTSTNLQTNDLFSTEERNKFDSLVMNPPFLRNEDVPADIKSRYLANIEACTGGRSFIRNVRQPNLYFYFVEKAVSMLKEDGKASIILMTKFLNNKDGEHLKRYLLPYIEAIIAYTPSFFEGFRVTTCIIVLSKTPDPDGTVSFLKVIDTDILSNTDEVKKLIQAKKNVSDTKYSLVVADKKSLKPEANWRAFLIDPEGKFHVMESLRFLKPLETFFGTVKRGQADNVGGSSLIFPLSSNNPLSDYVAHIEPEFLGFGMQVNKIHGGRRKFILEKDCLETQKGLMVPEPFDEDTAHGLAGKYSHKTGLDEYYRRALDTVIKKRKVRWDKVVNCAYRSEVRPNIFLPRADRVKHSVYYNPFKDQDILVSTNFFYLDDFVNYNPEIPVEDQLKFITAWLLSSFGQIQFEMHANNQEGMRKIEGGMIRKLRIPDLKEISPEEISEVIGTFEKLNRLDKDVSGLEGTDNPRKDLDQAIGRMIFRRNRLNFEDPDSLTEFFENFLMELVMDRVNQ